MNHELSQAVATFLTKSSVVGVAANVQEINRLNEELAGIIPQWYISLITTFPICGIELGWRSTDAVAEGGELTYLEWLGPDGIRSEMCDCYPGIALLSKGYLCVAGCCYGSGDQYYIPTTCGDDPPVYQISHDVSDDADKILTNGRHVVVSRLSQLFSTGVPAD